MTAPDDTDSNPPGDPAPSPTPPPPDEPPDAGAGRQTFRQRLRTYHDTQLDGGGRGTVIAALIGVSGVLLTVWATLHVASDDGNSDSNENPAVSAPTTPGHPGAAGKPYDTNSPQPPPTPSTPETPEPSTAIYELVYKDRKVSVSLPEYWGFGTLDLDRPRAQNLDSAEYKRMQARAEAEGELVEPDILYRTDEFTELVTEKGRSAAYSDASPPWQPNQCAMEAEAGAFDAMRMSQWTAEAGSGFCLITDLGNVVRLQITKFVGGDRNIITAPPQRIEFSATMWRGSTAQ